MSVSQMQGVPSHLETLKSNDRERRHPAYCIFADGKGGNRRCKSPQSPIYMQPCHSASKCDYYEKLN